MLTFALAVALVVVLTYGVRGCEPAPEREPEGSTYVPPGGESTTTFSGGQTSEATFSTVPVIMTGRVGHDSFEGIITAALSPDGTSYLVGPAFQRGNRKYQGFKVFDATGEPLWEHIFSNASYRASQAVYLAGGKFIGAEALDYEEGGEFHLLDSQGRYLLSHTVKGWVRPVVSEEGAWLALFDEVHRTLDVFGPPDLGPVWHMKVALGATGFFVGDGPEFFLSEAGKARLLDARGQAVWTIDIPQGSHWMAVPSPDPRYFAATTQDPDSTLYLCSMADGSLVWSQFLVAGGKKEITFSPDGGSIVASDVGKYGDVYLLNAINGEIVWRFRLQGREDSSLAFESLRFTPSGHFMVADVVESTRTDSADLYYHYLLLMTPDGRAIWVSPLGAQADVSVSAAVGLALVTTNNTYELGGSVVNHVTLVSFPSEPTPLPGP